MQCASLARSYFLAACTEMLVLQWVLPPPNLPSPCHRVLLAAPSPAGIMLGGGAQPGGIKQNEGVIRETRKAAQCQGILRPWVSSGHPNFPCPHPPMFQMPPQH